MRYMDDCDCRMSAYEDGYDVGFEDGISEATLSLKKLSPDSKDFLETVNRNGMLAYEAELSDVPLQVQLYLQQLSHKISKLAREALL